ESALSTFVEQPVPETEAPRRVAVSEVPASRAGVDRSASDAESDFVPSTKVDDQKLVDFQQLRNCAGFAARAVRRHVMISAAVFVGTVAGTAVCVSLWPRTYHVEAKLMLQRNDLMTALSNPGRAIRPEADDPSRAASETILDHDNLASLVGQTNLLTEWGRTRAPILRAKDRLFGLFRQKLTDAERFDTLVDVLEQRLWVTVTSEGVVTIGIDWPDARLAYELVRAALQNFVQIRQIGTTSAITKS